MEYKNFKEIFLIYKVLFLFFMHMFVIVANANDKILQLMKVKNPDCTLKSEFLIALKNLFNAEILVETGSSGGNTTDCASKIFNNVYSIEMMDELYKEVFNRFKSINNVHVFHGRSEKVLLKILPKIEGKVIFWLDAHYCGSNTGMSDYLITKSQTPIIDELDAIFESKIENPVILIDDVRLFSDPYWPSLEQVHNKIKELFPDYDFIIFGDIAISFSKKENVTVSKLLKSITISRLFDDQTKKNITLNSVLESEDTILKATGSECEDLLYTCNIFSNESHLNLWSGLIHYNKGNFSKALNDFKKSQDYHLRIRNWRIYLYMAKTALKLNDFELYKKLVRKAMNKIHKNDEINSFTNVKRDITSIKK